MKRSMHGVRGSQAVLSGKLLPAGRLGALVAALIAGCGPGEQLLSLDTDEVSSAILGGTSLGSAEFPATGFLIHTPVSPIDRSCIATRLGPNIGITAGHCLGAAADHRFAWGDKVRGASSLPLKQVKQLSPYDLALFEIDGCPPAVPYPRLAEAQDFTDQYTVVSYLHTSSNANGARRKLAGLELTSNGVSLATEISCSVGSVWGGDSGSALYKTRAPGPSVGRDELVGITQAVYNFCDGTHTSQTILHGNVSYPASRVLIDETLAEWTASSTSRCSPGGAVQ